MTLKKKKEVWGKPWRTYSQDIPDGERQKGSSAKPKPPGREPEEEKKKRVVPGADSFG